MKTTIDLTTKTLAQVSDLYRDGRITCEQAEEYAILWNKGPHFTTAIVRGSSITNIDCDHEDFTENQDGDRTCRDCGLTMTWGEMFPDSEVSR